MIDWSGAKAISADKGMNKKQGTRHDSFLFFFRYAWSISWAEICVTLCTERIPGELSQNITERANL